MGESTEGRTSTARRPGTIGDFELLSEIGRGGMGIVYKARQTSMGRVVAVKVLPTFAALDGTAIGRFRREAQAAGQLAHPGIVPIFAVGEEHGTYYYAMELVEGPTLGELLRSLSGRVPQSLRMSLTEEAGHAGAYPKLDNPPGDSAVGRPYVRCCAVIAAEIASSLAVAHRAGVVHRDLKPNNLLVSTSGRLVLVDFGLACAPDAHGLTRTGDVVGTPAYMAPEQASGGEVDGRADVYALGTLLYEMLALRPPHVGGTALEVTRQIVDVDPEPLRKLNSSVPVDLETIVHTCLSKDPDRRYANMEALEADLWAFLGGRAIWAQRPSTSQRLARWKHRHSRTIAVAAVTLLIAAGIVGTAGIVMHQDRQADGAAVLAQARGALVEDLDLRRAGELYARAAALVDDPALREAQLEHVRAAVAAHYPDHLDALRASLEVLPAATRHQLGDVRQRLDGIGTLVWSALPEVPGWSVEIRDPNTAAPWRPLPPGVPLPIGDYLLRTQAPGKSPLVQCITVRRDSETVLDAHLHAPRDVPAGMVQIVDPDTLHSVAAATAELSNAEVQSCLERIDSPSLRAELTPAPWREANPVLPDRPVQGLSYRQAMGLAAHLDGHLPTWREYWLAATAGLDRRPYPWGSQFEPGRVVADPKYRQGPEPITSTVTGASPLGVLHLVGNVAEILNPDADGLLVMAGGHYQSLAPPALRLNDRDGILAELSAPEIPNHYAGMRLFRFLPRARQPHDAEVESAAEQRRSEILGSGRASMFHDWTVGPAGELDYALTMAGMHSRNEREQELQFVTGGFVQLGQLSATDGHGRALQVRSALSADGEFRTLGVQRENGIRQGQRFELHLATRLLPTSGLNGARDSYVLQLPIKTVGLFPVACSLKLPAGCHADSIDPPPTATYVGADGASHFLWEFGTGHKPRVLPLVVRFRKDGMLTERWPVAADVIEFAEQFFAEQEAAAPGVRSSLHHRLFAGRPIGPRWQNRRYVDVTAVGRVVTIGLLADLKTLGRDRRDVTVRDWPLRLQIVRAVDGDRVLRLTTRGMVDSGSINEDGEYRHAALGVAMRPPDDVVMVLTQDELTEMQVLCIDPEHPTARLQLLGHYALDGESPPATRFRLSAGAADLRRGEALSADADAPNGVSEWLFDDPSTGVWSRERWQYVAKGRRHFLLKATAAGRSRAEALAAFEARRPWFDRLGAALRIE